MIPFSKIVNTHIKKEWLMESKAFSISTIINNPSISKELVILRTSDISLPLSPINLLLTYATWFSFTMVEITLFNRLASTFEISTSHIYVKTGLQFLMNLWSLSFISINFITACFWEILNSPTIKDCWIEAKEGSSITPQNFM